METPETTPDEVTPDEQEGGDGGNGGNGGDGGDVGGGGGGVE
ncbi:MAG TPA: hypothetical protein VGO83_11495 [Thermoleophilaceae bacterium]|jgi:hypothetical protein|nr:hypothetical protein [Thermoleophilaceae bacterium]